MVALPTSVDFVGFYATPVHNAVAEWSGGIHYRIPPSRISCGAQGPSACFRQEFLHAVAVAAVVVVRQVVCHSGGVGTQRRHGVGGADEHK